MTGLALAAIVLGLGYGAAAPASTHLLVPQTPRPVFNMVMSLRQIGVPFGGVMAALILPPLALLIGWRGALAELGPVLLLILLLEVPADAGTPTETSRDASSAAPCCNHSHCCPIRAFVVCPLPLSSMPVWRCAWSLL